MNKAKKAILVSLCLTLCACATEYVVTIKSDPNGAVVTDMNRGKLGKTNLEVLVVEKGSKYANLNLTFSKDGYTEEKLDILKIRNNQTVMVTLHSAPTYLYVKSIPPSAKIRIFDTEGKQLKFIDNPKISRVDYFANRRHKVPNDLNKVLLQLEHLGYKPLSKEVIIEPHKENRFSFQMEKVSPILKVKSIPNGAEVHERTLGFLGRTPLKLSLKWAQIMRLSQQYDVMSTSSVNFQFFIKKKGYKTEEIVQEFSVYKHNPDIWVNLEKKD